jgi:hypothetical protein
MKGQKAEVIRFCQAHPELFNDVSMVPIPREEVVVECREGYVLFVDWYSDINQQVFGHWQPLKWAYADDIGW